MTEPADCLLLGRWRIVEADLWERDYLDLVEPTTMTIRADGHGEIAFGAMQASLDLEYSHSMVFFTWVGFDEMDEVSGSGSAELLDDARSKSSSPTISATRPSSRLDASRPQQPARGGRSRRCRRSPYPARYASRRRGAAASQCRATWRWPASATSSWRRRWSRA